MTGITTATRQGGGLVCVDTSRDTGIAPGVSIAMEISCRDKLPRPGKVIWDGALTMSSTSLGGYG